MSIRLRSNKIVIDFYTHLPDGRKIRCVETEGLNTEANMKRVRSKEKAIKYHLKEGTFDYLKFYPHGSKAKYFKQTESDMVFSEWWEKWMETK